MPGPETLSSLAEQQRQNERQIILAAQIAREERARLLSTLASARAKATALDAEMNSQRKVIDSMQQSNAALQTVVDKGYYSRLQFEQRRQQLLQAQQQLGALEERARDNDSMLTQTLAQLARVPLDQATTESTRRAAIESLHQDEIKTRQSGGYLITAPVGGEVSGLQIRVGNVVDAAKPLMTINPASDQFAVDLFAPSAAVGFLRPGQEVRLMFDAFPYQKYGSFTGRVQSVARSILRPDQTDSSLKLEESAYRVRVRLTDASLVTGDARIRLQAGMTLVGDIVLDRRSFLDWLLEPLNAVHRRS
jgi:membrane fusion protein